MHWLRKALGLHEHRWTRFGQVNVPDQYRPADGLLPAQRLVGRILYYRFCDCGKREQYYPEDASAGT